VDGLRWDATNYIRNIDADGDPTRDIPDGWNLMQSTITTQERQCYLLRESGLV
jgi:hypothetical protein